ncbi:hypothetical protein BC939DRAFT_234490 [Gamsiella multidivaricata]|uniref:uncharacterized protein n=1 Tax=Gamsiella multidivaricata TaxID=101098 RepID=UPI00221EDCB9|nr:uncharacterized protein BC939DRAFT_234490 [Gamsiella multidivaricata]KAI7820431.1 hypothetical protein BC939DRAFT_234490 [Gamsiella multidivaricata]
MNNTNMEPGGMAMASLSPMDDAALRAEQFQEHQLRLQEKFRLQHQQQMGLAQTSAHPHEPDGMQPYYNSQGQLTYPTSSPCYEAKPKYGLGDFDLLETLGKLIEGSLLIFFAFGQSFPLLLVHLFHFFLFIVGALYFFLFYFSLLHCSFLMDDARGNEPRYETCMPAHDGQKNEKRAHDERPKKKLHKKGTEHAHTVKMRSIWCWVSRVGKWEREGVHVCVCNLAFFFITLGSQSKQHNKNGGVSVLVFAKSFRLPKHPATSNKHRQHVQTALCCPPSDRSAAVSIWRTSVYASLLLLLLGGFFFGMRVRMVFFF